MTAYTRSKTLELTNVKKGASAASLTITQWEDGSVSFLDKDSNLVVIPSAADDWAIRLIEAIDALV